MAWTSGLTAVADFWWWRLVEKIWGFVVAKRIQRPCAGVTPGPLKRVDSGNQVARDEHQLQAQGSRHVLNRREPGVDRCALEIGDLSLA